MANGQIMYSCKYCDMLHDTLKEANECCNYNDSEAIRQAESNCESRMFERVR